MSKLTAKSTVVNLAGYGEVCDGIVELLDTSRQAAARNVNALMTATYWEVCWRIVEGEQSGKRAMVSS
jgi:hypothetical protein